MQSVTGKPVNCRIRSITETNLPRPAIVCLACWYEMDALFFLVFTSMLLTALLLLSWCAGSSASPETMIRLESLKKCTCLNDRRIVNDAKGNFSLNDEKISNEIREWSFKMIKRHVTPRTMASIKRLARGCPPIVRRIKRCFISWKFGCVDESENADETALSERWDIKLFLLRVWRKRRWRFES